MAYTNQIGVIFELSRLLNEGAAPLLDLDVECVQLNCFDSTLLTRENAEKAKETLAGKIRISSFWCGWSGPMVWDMVDGPHTLGIVPIAYRAKRMDELMMGADFAEWLGVTDMTTHAGFVPEQPSFPEYRGVVIAIRQIAEYCASKGLFFNFETGQETPTALMRLIADTGCGNLGINLDPANLLLYGRGNPVDALDMFAGYIRGVHVKDGDYPKGNFYKLGEERVVGEGSVNFPVFLPKLLNQGYTGNLYIEREISGPQQAIDIKKTVAYVRSLLKSEG